MGKDEALFPVVMDTSKKEVYQELFKIVTDYAREMDGRVKCLTRYALQPERDRDRERLGDRDRDYRDRREREDRDRTAKVPKHGDKEKKEQGKSRAEEEWKKGVSQEQSWTNLVGKVPEAELRKMRFQYCRSVTVDGAKCGGDSAEKCKFYHIGCYRCLKNGKAPAECAHAPINCPDN
jgi:hypothetical protein